MAPLRRQAAWRARWAGRTILAPALLGAAWASTWPAAARAQGPANFHPCNAQPALPICQHGYGKRVAVMRWGALPESGLSGPLDPDAKADASLTTLNPAKEIEKLRSSTVYVQDMSTSDVLFARNADVVRPIASITKLMTALVAVDAGLRMDESIRIEASDNDMPSDLPSRLAVGARLTRSDLLHLALMASENSAAHALGRTYPGGMAAFVQAMNAKARQLDMNETRFVEPTGLSNENVSSPRDLARLAYAASRRALIQRYSTDTQYKVAAQDFRNTNMLVGRPEWTILASKTGTTRMAGDCLVMLARLGNREVSMVLLNAGGTSGSRFGDAVRVRRILGSQMAMK
ncbi:serine hydrolase [Achromobacter aloeverae]|uniref:D-alanyl-D-alanine endopeptidase n=1 Tax=Achromobacter aloeverae TaxID=1750518 RepID=A0A4Q1HLP3_9BURK|nr:serine hydrolase [Achromobacter aloeverae]RXN91377.1 D-alanyl-D-alanine endopeptidase [Achromobacter aloeverae]